MPPPFKQISREQFAHLIGRFEFKRQIDAVHMHHTWRPNHSQYDPKDGHRAILGMFLHHTRINHWQDIAQHVTIAPDGAIWLGRHWNLPPASAAGHNGNIHSGPFMFEVIGDFDIGRDKLDGEQRKTVIEVIAQVQRQFSLPPETLRFHNAMSSKSCPGSSIGREELLREVRERLEQLARGADTPREARRSPFPPEADATTDAVEKALAWFGREVPPYVDSPNAEPLYEDTGRGFSAESVVPTERAPEGLTTAKLLALRPHLVNLNAGKFSSDGEWDTTEGEVDAIFDHDLQVALEANERELPGQPLRIVFFAHGGLVKESSGLEIAHKHLAWWKENKIYPIYFVWETGLFETIGQLLSRAQTGARNFVSDHVTDPLIETIAHKAGGVMIWGGMKSAAELASANQGSLHGEGGAHYVARKLKEFCARNADRAIELHAVGHSAGSIFRAHFLSATQTLGIPSFRTVHFLAPAIRVDVFLRLLKNSIGTGKGIDHLSLFTMRRDLERDDQCAMIYRKSLLYLIHYALEPERREPILGLEESLRGDPVLRHLFALDSPKTGDAEVVFSPSPIGEGRSASLSTTHGGFDDDRATMNSVLRRILGKADADEIVSYPPSNRRAFDLWSDQVDWPERSDGGPRSGAGGAGSGASAASPSAAAGDAIREAQPSAPRGARRRALCIGIDQYAAAPLSGCVADSEDWARLLQELGFETSLMRNAEATYAEILRRLGAMIAESAAGDVLVFQFAGHGTQLHDLDADEDDPGDDKDEAMVPYDYTEGAFLIDDDVRELIDRLPQGVNLTCFFDCCHSGTNTRFAIGATGLASGRARDERRRFLAATPEMQTAHANFRNRFSRARSFARGGRESMKNVAFSACMPHESAWESDGHGDFTVRAVRILSAGIGGMTNEQFGQRISAEFGAGARQRPLLDCAPDAGPRGLLAPIDAAATSACVENSTAAPVSAATLADVKTTLKSLIERL